MSNTHPYRAYPGQHARVKQVRQFFLDRPGCEGTTREIAEAVGGPVHLVRHALLRMQERGLVVGVGSAGVLYRWRATAEIEAETVSYREGAVRTVLAHGPLTTRELAKRAGVCPQSTWVVLTALEQQGVVVRHHRAKGGHVWTLVEHAKLAPMKARQRLSPATRTTVDPDDEPWTPPTGYLTAARRYALGLPVAGRRAA